MSEKSAFRKHWKLILNLITILALAVLIYLIRHQIGSTLRNITHINGWALVLMIPIELLNYHMQAKMYQKMFAVVGNKLDYKYLYKAALELNLINHLFPSGGVTGISYFSVKLSGDDKISGGKASLIQIMKLVLTILSFELLLMIGLLSLALFGRVDELTILVAATLSTLLLAFTVAFAYIVGSRSRINSFFTSMTQALNWLIHLIFRKHPETINILGAKKVFNDFHDNYQQLISHWRELKSPFRYAFLANVTEVLAIYVVYLAFGHSVNIGAVILAYGVANFAGLVSVLPGGIGIYEALMTAVLATAGIPPRLSLPVTIMYRVVNTLIQLPPGYYLYHKTINRKATSLRA